MILDLVTGALVCAGMFFFFATTVGILRFPDFYTRMHAAGKGDTLSSMLVLAGLALYNLQVFSLAALLVSAKIIFILIFIFLASPTATHAIIDAGYQSRLEPWVKETPREKDGAGA